MQGQGRVILKKAIERLQWVKGTAAGEAEIGTPKRIWAPRLSEAEQRGEDRWRRGD